MNIQLMLIVMMGMHVMVQGKVAVMVEPSVTPSKNNYSGKMGDGPVKPGAMPTAGGQHSTVIVPDGAKQQIVAKQAQKSSGISASELQLQKLLLKQTQQNKPEIKLSEKNVEQKVDNKSQKSEAQSQGKMQQSTSEITLSEQAVKQNVNNKAQESGVQSQGKIENVQHNKSEITLSEQNVQKTEQPVQKEKLTTLQTMQVSAAKFGNKVASVGKKGAESVNGGVQYVSGMVSGAEFSKGVQRSVQRTGKTLSRTANAITGKMRLGTREKNNWEIQQTLKKEIDTLETTIQGLRKKMSSERNPTAKAKYNDKLEQALQDKASFEAAQKQHEADPSKPIDLPNFSTKTSYTVNDAIIDMHNYNLPQAKQARKDAKTQTKALEAIKKDVNTKFNDLLKEARIDLTPQQKIIVEQQGIAGMRKIIQQRTLKNLTKFDTFLISEGYNKQALEYMKADAAILQQVS